jgi:hypothetical protein
MFKTPVSPLTILAINIYRRSSDLLFDFFATVTLASRQELLYTFGNTAFDGEVRAACLGMARESGSSDIQLACVIPLAYNACLRRLPTPQTMAAA